MNRAKRAARERAKATGEKYTEARRATRIDKPVQVSTSPMARTAREWAEYSLRDRDLASLGAGIDEVEWAEVESASTVEWSVDWQLIEEYEGEMLLHSLTFQVEVEVRGTLKPAEAAALVARGEGRVLEDLGRDGVQVLLNPRIANVELIAREENEEIEVTEIMAFTWDE